MTGIPAYCENCRMTFELQNFVRGKAPVGFFLKGNATNCPRCGGTAVIADGAYHFEGGITTLMSGPPLTWEMVNALKGVVKDARNNKSTAQDILADIAEVSPELAETLKSRFAFPSVVLILLLIWMIKALELNVTVDFNRVLDQGWAIANGAPLVDEESFDPDAIAIPDEAIIKDDPVQPPSFTTAALSTNGADPRSHPQNRKARRQAASQARKSKSQA